LAKQKSAETPTVPHSDAGYVVVARRYRPKGFSELVGQGHVGQALRNAIETNRVGHAYLFTGARGVGKTSTARIFAKALNNPDGPSAEFDPQTDIAAAIDAGEDVDVIEIDGASNRGIDEIRSLRANVGVRPSRARYKIYIIDEVHMLTGAAFNALLKTLEEPPEHVKFIFCTTDPEKIPITVLSRCQRFDFAPVEVGEIVGRLREIVAGENASADDEALELIARRASGSMRDSQSLLEQVMSFSDGKLTADNVHSMLGTADDERLLALSKAMADRDAATSLAMLDAAIDAGVDAGRLAEQLLGYFRDLLAVTVGCDASLQRHTALSMHGELKTLGERWGLQTVLAVVGLIDQTLVRIRHSVYGRVLLEATLIQICHLPDLQAIADLAAAGPTASTEKKKISRAEPPAIVLRPVANIERPAIVHKPIATPPQSASPGTVSMESTDSAAIETLNAESAPLATIQSSPSQIWDAKSIESQWKNVIDALPEMTAAMVRVAEKADVSTAGVVRLVFPSESALAMKRCEQLEHRDAIVASIAQQCGPLVRLEFATAPPKARPVVEKPVAQRANRIQRSREIEASPLIQSCLDQFGAQIVKVDFPA
jgi:DNA polymerase III subunit gamma/tau